MSATTPLNDIFKSAPSASGVSGLSMLMVDGSGNPAKGSPSSLFPLRKGLVIPQNSIVRIRNISSVLVSLRGSSGGRCCLIWFSGYGPGTTSRITWAAIRANSAFKWYVNGESESSASVYLENPASQSYSDTISVVSLSSEIPEIQIVPSLPSDAKQVSITVGGGGNSLLFKPLRNLAERRVA